MATDNVEISIDPDYQDGMKSPTIENWLVPDKLAVMTTIGLGLVLNPPKVEAAEGGRIVARLAAFALANNVPKEVRKLFAAAKGAMCYGYLFYPLYAIAEDRLYLTLERAVKIRARETGCRPDGTFADSIAWLCKRGHIDHATCVLLGVYRRGRNEAMHAEFQTIVPPTNSIRFALRIAKLIDLLFESVDEDMRTTRAGQPEHDHSALPS